MIRPFKNKYSCLIKKQTDFKSYYCENSIKLEK